MMTPDYGNSEYEDALLDLFNPGNGGEPPLLAGREAPLAALQGFLRRLTGKRPLGHDIVLYGPRGNGKTVLLGKFRQRCGDVGLDILKLKAAEVETRGALARRLLGAPGGKQPAPAPSSILQWVKDKGAALRRQAPDVGVKEIKAGPVILSQQSDAQLDLALDEALAARCREWPLVVTLDEAHTLDIQVGRRLLNLSESLREEGAPFLLVLAGTPHLREHLGRMDASFWGRAEKLGIGRLNRAATAEALVKPLAGKGIAVDENALAAVVDESQCYPYFIQVWGKALCRALVEEKRQAPVNMATVDAARPHADFQRDDYYADRYREMEKRELLPAAVTMGQVFDAHGQERVDADTLHRALMNAGIAANNKRAMLIRDQLSDLGYLWSPPASVLYEPGIPSLVAYMQAHCPDSLRPAPPESEP